MRPTISSVTFLNKYSWQLFLTTRRNTHRGPLQQTSTMWVMKYTPLDKTTIVLPSFHFEEEMWHECGQRLTKKPSRQPGFSEQRIWQVHCKRRERKWWETWIQTRQTQADTAAHKTHYYYKNCIIIMYTHTNVNTATIPVVTRSCDAKIK